MDEGRLCPEPAVRSAVRTTTYTMAAMVSACVRSRTMECRRTYLASPAAAGDGRQGKLAQRERSQPSIVPRIKE